MAATIASMKAMEVLDSRSWPTVRVHLGLGDGQTVAASVPAGASTGKEEARECRDGDTKRYGGRGVCQAVEHIHRVIAPALIGSDPTRQAGLDQRLLELDGTSDKSNLGANTILAVSLALARAGAVATGLPLYQYLGGATARRLPVPMMNLINGGAHADNPLEFQEFMIVPHGAPTFAEALRYGAETFHALKTLLRENDMNTGVGDEGGYAPNLETNEIACQWLVRAIERAGFRPGEDISLALDPAANGFYLDDGRYDLTATGGSVLSREELTQLYRQWIDRYPIISIEDGFAEEDWEGFAHQTAQIGDRVQIVGDDLLVTNPSTIRRAIRKNACNAALIKLNQIGTVTETVEAIELCRAAGWAFVISHRSGETEDSFIADFAVAMGGGQIKTGSLSRSERIAKYNRLLEIEAEIGSSADFGRPG